jgi:hypothetical protein
MAAYVPDNRTSAETVDRNMKPEIMKAYQMVVMCFMPLARPLYQQIRQPAVTTPEQQKQEIDVESLTSKNRTRAELRVIGISFRPVWMPFAARQQKNGRVVSCAVVPTRWIFMMRMLGSLMNVEITEFFELQTIQNLS